jgi:hypothetical protein
MVCYSIWFTFEVSKKQPEHAQKEFSLCYRSNEIVIFDLALHFWENYFPFETFNEEHQPLSQLIIILVYMEWDLKVLSIPSHDSV